MRNWIIILSAYASLSQTALAQDIHSAHSPREFSAEIGTVVEAAMNEMNREQYARALPVLEQANSWATLSPYERATVEQMRGAVFYELGDKQKAINAFEAAQASGGLTADENLNLLSNIGQLKIANGDFADGASTIEDWVSRGGVLNPHKQEMLMQAWIEADQYDRALPYAEKWFSNANPKQRKHYDLMNFLYNSVGMPDEQAEILREMEKRRSED